MIEIVPSFLVSYDGADADQHILDAAALGESIGGASRLYTAVAHYCVFGAVPRGNYKKEFRCYASIPRDGSYEIPLLIAALAQQQALYAPLYAEGIKFIFAYVLKAIKDQWTKSSSTERIVEALVDAIKEQARAHAEVQMVATNGLVKANDNLASLNARLIDTLPALAESTRSNGRALVEPVGKSCRSLTQLAQTADAVVIDEPEAAVIKSTEPLEISNVATFKCDSITEVNTETGHCRIVVDGFQGTLVGKITDPSLSNPHNVYTQALNAHTGFTFTAKPVKRDGVVKTLYISDAKELA